LASVLVVALDLYSKDVATVTGILRQMFRANRSNSLDVAKALVHFFVIPNYDDIKRRQKTSKFLGSLHNAGGQRQYNLGKASRFPILEGGVVLFLQLTTILI
jgi:hypothetical protein